MRDKVTENFMRENSNYLNRFDRDLDYTVVNKDKEEPQEIDKVIEYINSNLLKESELNTLKRSSVCDSDSYKSKGIKVKSKDAQAHIEQIADTFVIYVGRDVKDRLEIDLDLITDRAYKIVSKQIDSKYMEVEFKQATVKNTSLRITVAASEEGVHKKRFKLNLVGQPRKYTVLSFLIVFNNKR